jgi:hypothetical protein
MFVVSCLIIITLVSHNAVVGTPGEDPSSLNYHFEPYNKPNPDDKLKYSKVITMVPHNAVEGTPVKRPASLNYYFERYKESNPDDKLKYGKEVPQGHPLINYAIEKLTEKQTARRRLIELKVQWEDTLNATPDLKQYIVPFFQSEADLIEYIDLLKTERKKLNELKELIFHIDDRIWRYKRLLKAETQLDELNSEPTQRKTLVQNLDIRKQELVGQLKLSQDSIKYLEERKQKLKHEITERKNKMNLIKDYKKVVASFRTLKETISHINLNLKLNSALVPMNDESLDKELLKFRQYNSSKTLWSLEEDSTEDDSTEEDETSFDIYTDDETITPLDRADVATFWDLPVFGVDAMFP